MSLSITPSLRRQLAHDAGASVAETILAVEDDESPNNNVLATILSNLFLFLLIFGLSATVSVGSLRHQLGNKFALLTGVGMQFVIMPLLGFASVMILDRGSDGFTQAMGISLLVVTSSPGGSYSNWWCSMFNAELSLSVAMTAVSTMLSVGMLPTNLMLYSYLAYGDEADDEDDLNVLKALDFGSLFISLGIVMCGILLGLYCSYKTQSKRFQKWANRAANVSGIALILVSVLLSSVGVETNFWNQHWKFYVGVAFPCVVGLALANFLSRCFQLNKPECVAISIECCYQNTGIATSVAVTMFSDPEVRAQAVAVPLFYGLVEAVLIGIYCIWAWKAGWTKAPAGEKLCVVIAHTYEVEDSDHASPELELTDEDENLEASADAELPDDLPRIAEEEAPRKWWQIFGKKRERAECGHVSAAGSSSCKQNTSKAAQQLFASNATCEATRTRLVSEDMTVATGLSSTQPRSRFSSEDNVTVTAAAPTSPAASGAMAMTIMPTNSKDEDESESKEESN
jgi:predicted Na+-dependent transporter